MSNTPPVVVLFHGDDEPTLRDDVVRFLEEHSADDMNTTRLEGKTASAADIEGAAATLPFLAEVRLVVVSNITEAPQAKTFVKKEVIPMFERLPAWARVIFVETGLHKQPGDSQNDSRRKSTRRGVLKTLTNAIENDPRGVVYTYTVPDRESNRAKWIQKRAGAHAAEIEMQAAVLLAQRVGHDLSLIDNELLKLATYTNGQRAIVAQDVDLLTPYEPEVGIFPLVDAIGQRNGRDALDKLRSLLEEDNQSPMQVFSMIIRQYRLLLQVREQLDKGQTVNGIQQMMGLHPFVAKKLAGQAQRYNLRLLERIYEVLLEMDLAIKTGKQKDHQLALEMFITRLSR